MYYVLIYLCKLYRCVKQVVNVIFENKTIKLVNKSQQIFLLKHFNACPVGHVYLKIKMNAPGLSSIGFFQIGKHMTVVQR